MEQAPTTYQIRVSAVYADDHQECTSLPATVVRRTAHGVTLLCTLGQLVELISRAEHYADRDHGRELAESGYYDLHRSAIKACEQIKKAGLWHHMKSAEGKAAYRTEWDAANAR